MNTPEHFPRSGTEMVTRCVADHERWPCTAAGGQSELQATRAHLADALEVVEEFRGWHDAWMADDYTSADDVLRATGRALREYDAQCHPKTPNSAGASHDAPGAGRG